MSKPTPAPVAATPPPSPATNATPDRAALDAALARIAPPGGVPQLLVSAGFNSAI